MDQLKLDLKRFERKFEKKYGRPPGREDIRALPDVKSKYKQYAAFQIEKQRQSAKDPVEKTPQRNEPVELGPTPQIYGKVIGLFDMKVSPLKNTRIISPEASSSRIQTEISVQKQLEVKRCLDFNLTPKISPKRYAYGPNSPLKFDDIQLSIHTPRRNLRNLIAENDNNSAGSPSPIIKRHLGKPLLQIARENERMMKETDALSDDEVISSKVKDVFGDDEDDDLDAQTEDELGEEEVIFKRSKRKHILRPAKSALKTVQPLDVNVKEEMARLKQQAIDEFNGVEPTKPLVTQASVASVTKTTRTKNKKYNLVSNNFRRLKLPKSKGKGNKKWGRR
ncbi:LANO_0D06568g1_1 [Lachancea nothofagi CBS 11611]|uniref:DNA replication regulator SLD2 n=1 Tax=Lachancea nothofagi CBS 11611 TaxID=1266666 RepID=A0A1G4JHL0_9SACH|nr:LANO_0D06568g1_1 [Lachancea nothofagi CBS 11611]